LASSIIYTLHLYSFTSVYQPSLDKPLISRLRDIIKRHQGLIAEEEEGATHIVHGMPAASSGEGRGSFGATLKPRNNECIVRMLEMMSDAPTNYVGKHVTSKIAFCILPVIH